MQTQKDLIARPKDLSAKQKTPQLHGEYFSNSLRVGAPTGQPNASKTKKQHKKSPPEDPIGSEAYRPPIGGLGPLIGGLVRPKCTKSSPGLVLVCDYPIFVIGFVPHRGIVPD